jgi:hypothetical protein
VLDKTAHVMERLSDVQAKVAATTPEEPIPVLDRIQVLARRTRNFIRGY